MTPLFPTSLGNDDNLVKELGWCKQLKRRLVWLAKLAFPDINTQTVQIAIVSDGAYSVRVPVIKSLAVDKLFGEADPIAPIDIKAYDIRKWRSKGRLTHTEHEAAFFYDKENDVIYVRSFRYYPGRERRLVWRSYYA